MNYIEIMGRIFGTNSKRPVVVDSSGYLQADIRKPATLKTVTVTVALPAAAGYTAQDVLSNSATEGIGKPWEFDLAREPGGSFLIINGLVETEVEDIVPRLTGYVYTRMPTCNLADNVPHIGPAPADRSFFVGTIDFPAMEDTADATGSSYSFISTSTYGNLPMAVTCESNNDRIYVVLVTRDAITYTTTENLTMKLTAIQY